MTTRAGRAGRRRLARGRPWSRAGPTPGPRTPGTARDGPAPGRRAPPAPAFPPTRAAPSITAAVAPRVTSADPRTTEAMATAIAPQVAGDARCSRARSMACTPRNAAATTAAMDRSQYHGCRKAIVTSTTTVLTAVRRRRARAVAGRLTPRSSRTSSQTVPPALTTASRATAPSMWVVTERRSWPVPWSPRALVPDPHAANCRRGLGWLSSASHRARCHDRRSRGGARRPGH